MVEVRRRIPEDELIKEMRGVTILNDPSIRPYAGAEMEIIRAKISDISPIQKYVLSGALRAQENLTKHLARSGHDPLTLDGGLELVDGKFTVNLVPPIVEEDPEHGLCLVDGTHRVYNARKAGRGALNILMVRNVLEETPLISYPNLWRDTLELDTVPADPRQKRDRRQISESRELRRDLSGINGSVRRPAGSAS